MYELVWDEGAMAELAALSAFQRRIVVNGAERQLRHQPDVETRNRKPLREPLKELPQAHGSCASARTAFFYWIPDRRTVAVLRVILKGTGTLTEAVGKGGRDE